MKTKERSSNQMCANEIKSNVMYFFKKKLEKKQTFTHNIKEIMQNIQEKQQEWAVFWDFLKKFAFGKMYKMSCYFICTHWIRTVVFSYDKKLKIPIFFGFFSNFAIFDEPFEKFFKIFCQHF